MRPPSLPARAPATTFAQLIETVGAQEVRGKEFDVLGKAVKGGAISGLFSLRSASPAGLLASVAVGALAGAGEVIAKRLAASEEELERLPEMLKSDPGKAIELMAAIATAEQWGRMASYGVSIGSTGARIASTGREEALPILMEEGGALLLNEQVN